MRFLLVILLIIFPTWAFSATSQAPKVSEESEQLLLVLTPSWESFQGKLLFFQRPRPQAPWEKVDGPIPVVVGKNGLGWPLGLDKNSGAGPLKKEGDGRSPVGVFKLGPVFGFLAQPGSLIKMAYFPLTESSFCVDDSHSGYYNQLLDRSSIAKPDWTSGEVMRQVPLYRWGAVIQFNQNPTQPGNGSCVFLHIWRGQDQGTAGCVAMEEASLLHLLGKLNPKKKPVIAILSAPAYRFLRKDWDLI